MQKLLYVGDPMCSWCWGFQATLELVHEMLKDIPVQYAKDSDEPMSADTVAYVQAQWRKVTALSGATFNWDFWEKCAPRRSTYPSCRAVIAASRQGKMREMFEAIQRAYYCDARNPADLPVLSQLAQEIGLDQATFDADIIANTVEADLQDGFNLRRFLNANSFPSLILMQDDSPVWLTKGYKEPDSVLLKLHQAGVIN